MRYLQYVFPFKSENVFLIFDRLCDTVLWRATLPPTFLIKLVFFGISDILTTSLQLSYCIDYFDPLEATIQRPLRVINNNKNYIHR